MMAAAAVTITEEREEIVDLSDQYYNSRRSLTVNTAETRTSPRRTSSPG